MVPLCQGNVKIRQDLTTVLRGIKITVSRVSFEFTFYQGIWRTTRITETQQRERAAVSDMGIASRNQLREHLLASRDKSIPFLSLPPPLSRGISDSARAKNGIRPMLLNGGSIGWRGPGFIKVKLGGKKKKKSLRNHTLLGPNESTKSPQGCNSSTGRYS